jgi:uncharacterized membrane protein YphA (DoxX/SURF4 family)
VLRARCRAGAARRGGRAGGLAGSLVMDVASLAARLVLAMVLAAAGVAKLADRAGARSAVTELGVPPGLASPLALVLPLVELVIAGMLVWDRSAVAGAIAALVLLAAFTAAITLSVARGRRPECHCFGQLSSKPAGGRPRATSCSAAWPLGSPWRGPAPALWTGSAT